MSPGAQGDQLTSAPLWMCGDGRGIPGRRNSISEGKEAGACSLETGSEEQDEEGPEGSRGLVVLCLECLEKEEGGDKSHLRPWYPLGDLELGEAATRGSRAPRRTWLIPLTFMECLLCTRPGAGHGRNSSEPSRSTTCLNGAHNQNPVHTWMSV